MKLNIPTLIFLNKIDRKGVCLDEINNCNLYPIFHGSALKNIGIDELLFAITNYLPINNDNTADNLSAYVYKIDRNEESRKITFLRVFSGNIKTRQEVHINSTDEILKIKSLESIMNGEIVKVDQVNSGDIALISNVNSLKIGDFIGEKYDGALDIKISQPALRASIQPYDLSKRSKLIEALLELTEEDPFRL